MSKHRTSAFLIGLLLLAMSALSVSAAITKVELIVAQRNATGRCPVTLKGTVRITVNAAGSVEYSTGRSDKVVDTPQSLGFARAGTKDVAVEFTFSSSFNGWVQAGAKAAPTTALPKPAVVLSAKIPLIITCANAKLTSAELPCQTEVYGGCCAANACNVVRITGQGFGAARMSQRLLVDGQPAASYQSWTDTEIVAIAPIALGDHTTTLAVDDGATVASNTLKEKFLMTWYMYGPRGCKAGEEVTCKSWGAGSSAAGKSLIMSKVGSPDYQMTIVSWTGTGNTAGDLATITFRIPANIPPAAWLLQIKKGSAVVSKPLSFGVLAADPGAR